MEDISLPFARLFSIKDEKEIELLRKSAHATVNAWNHLRRKIVDIVDTEKVKNYFFIINSISLAHQTESFG